MREPTKRSPADRGEVVLQGVCQICGAPGYVVTVPGAPAPNQFCEACAIEYGEGVAEDEEAAQ
ncbi:MAG TPA: hypothetical protein VIV59_04325 [Anaeromyxobacteraceae bacterium]